MNAVAGDDADVHSVAPAGRMTRAVTRETVIVDPHYRDLPRI